MDRNAHGRKVRLAYFGTVAPAAYGISAEPIGQPELLTATPGLYVVSAHWVAQAAGQGVSWLRDTKPETVIGHSLYVYRR